MAKPAFNPSQPFEPVKEKPAFDPSKPFEVIEEPKVPLAEKVETAGRSALEGITLGASEPIVAGINAVVGNLIEAGFDAETIGDFAKQAFSTEAIKQEYSKDIARRKGLEAKMPEVALPAEIAGGVLSGLATGGLATAARGAQAAKVLTAPVRAAEALAAAAGAKVPTAVGQAAVRGAVSAGGSEALKGAIQVPTGAAAPEEFDVLGAAKFGGALGGGLSAAAKGIAAIPSGAKKVVSALGGVSVDSIEQYLKDPKAVMRAKSPVEIKSAIDGYVDELNQAVESGKVSAEQAQEALNAAKGALDSEVRDRASEFAVAKFNAQEVKKNAQARLNDAVRTAKADTEAVMTAGKKGLRDQAVLAVETLKETVKKQSADSYKILEKSGRVVSVEPAKEAAQAALDALKIQGKPPVAGASAQAYKQIDGYLKDLKRYKNILSTSDAKKKIQQLDQDWQAALGAGDFTSSAQQALRSIRRAFDEQLKDIPEYAKLMDELSQNTDLLSRANKSFGSLEKAGTRVARIDMPQMDAERQLLLDLGAAVKRPFDKAIEDIQTAGSALKLGGVEARVMAGPLGQEARAAEAVMKELQVPGAKEAALAPILAGPKAQAVLEAERQVAARQAMIEGTRQKIKEIGPFARPATNISAIQSAVSEKNPEFIKYLKSLTEMSGQNFKQYIDDLRLAQEFGKEFRIGSRNVNIWALGSGAAAYGLTGDPTSSLVIAGLGGGFGGLVDRFGPRMTQKILDGYLKIEGLPTVKKIEQVYAGLPKEVIAQVKNDLIRSLAVADSEEITIEPARAQVILKDISDSDLSSVKKAQMMTAVNKGKPISSSDLSEVMMGKKAKPPLAIRGIKKETLNVDKPDILKALEEKEK
jgi:hypothetical protein